MFRVAPERELYSGSLSHIYQTHQKGWEPRKGLGVFTGIRKTGTGNSHHQ